MILSLIYARSENRCIGRDGRLPWRLPDEFAHFKRTTMGHPIIMGRRTFEDHSNVLPGRTNIVLTRRADFAYPGVVIARSLHEALLPYRDTHEEAFVIGGAALFTEAFPLSDRVYETVVHVHVAGDTYLPPFDFSHWIATPLHDRPADDRHAHAFTITQYDRPRL